MTLKPPPLTLSQMFEMVADEIEQSGATTVVPGLAPLWVPNAGPQTLALACQADELFYGGAGGGGKTDLLLGAALTQHRQSIIYRREFPQFRDMIERSKAIVPVSRGAFNEGLHIWKKVDGLRQLEFGSVQHVKDVEKYRGRPHDLKGFDELPTFTERQYRFLIAWNRTSIPGQRVRVIATGNPPDTDEGQWVISYWGPWLDPQHPNPAEQGELRYYANIDDKDTEVKDGTPFEHREKDGTVHVVTPRSRTFIKARVEDNPYYMNTGYADVLNALPEPLRSRMRFGNFGVVTNDDPWQVIPTAWVDAAMARWKARTNLGRPSKAGCDPSRGGEDQFVIAKAYDNWIAPLIKHAPAEAPDGAKGASLVFNALAGDTTVPVNIDVIGTAGGSVFDHAREMKLKAVAMNGSQASFGRDKSGKLGFVNKRAEWHWKVRELLDPTSGQDIALPPDRAMRADLCAPKWKPTPRGVQIEAKEDIKKRIGRSPDSGEAVIYVLNDEHTLRELTMLTGMDAAKETEDPEYQANYEAALAIYREGMK